MDTLKRLGLVALIATVMAVIGMELIALMRGQHVQAEELQMVIPRSIILWIVFSFVIRVRPLGVSIYIGLLSPFLGGLMFLHPFALVIIFTNLLICIGVGVTTGVLVYFAARDRGYS
jgi:hypothetical protein